MEFGVLKSSKRKKKKKFVAGEKAVQEELLSPTPTKEKSKKKKKNAGVFSQNSEEESATNNGQAQSDNLYADSSVSEHDTMKRKRKKESEDENLQTVDVRVSKKHKKKKHSSESVQQESEVEEAPKKKKKKKKYMDESEVNHELLLTETKEHKENFKFDITMSFDMGIKRKKKNQKHDESFVTPAKKKKKKDMDGSVASDQLLLSQKQKRLEPELDGSEAISDKTKKKKNHKKKENECGHFHGSVDLDVQVPKKKKLNQTPNGEHFEEYVEVHSEENVKRRKRKKKKENGCENSQSSVDFESERYVEDTVYSIVTPIKKKKKRVDEVVIKEELNLTEDNSKKKKNVDLTFVENHVKKLCDDYIRNNNEENKNNKENECENFEKSGALDIDIEGPKKHKKRKRLIENEAQEESEAVAHKNIEETEEIKQEMEENVKLYEKKNTYKIDNKTNEKVRNKTIQVERPKTVQGQEEETKRGLLRFREIFSLQNSDSDGPDEDELREEVACLEEEALKIKDKNRLSRVEQKILSELRITLPWPVHPLHLIETRITRTPTEKQKEMIKESGVEVKTSTYYSKAEDEQITKNWKEFCESHDLPEDPKLFLNMVNPDGQRLIPVPERLKFARFLAHNLNDRLLYSVYKRFRRLFPQQQLQLGRRFTPEDDKLIMKYIKMSLSRTPYSDLGALLGRDKLAVEKRARILAEEASFGNIDIKWDDKRAQEFINHIIDVTEVASVEDLKNREIDGEEWRILEERLKIPVRKLQKGWACRIYPTLFATNPVNTKHVKISLVRILIEKQVEELKTVDWNSIQEEMGVDGRGFTGRGLHELVQGMTNHSVPIDKRSNVKECLEYLQQGFKTGKLRGRTLKKLNVGDESG